jgi:branched-chain amino acid transport system ATP-binding protein
MTALELHEASAPASAVGGRLDVDGLTKAFYGVHALKDVSFAVAPGELVGLIGPNGSGKTTAVDCISGFQSPDAGDVQLDGTSIFRRPPQTLARRGVIRTFQSVRVFPSLTVRKNLRVAALGRLTGLRRVLELVRLDRPWASVDERINDLLDSFGLRHHAETPAGELSYGQRKLVEFAAACVRPPRVLLLDEPAAAVNPTIVNVIRDWILQLNRDGVSILLIEHNIELVVDICLRVVVLDHGEKIADGAPSEVVESTLFQEAYFGR